MHGIICTSMISVLHLFVSFQLPYFPDYKLLRSISRISQKMCHEEEKNIYKSHRTINHIYLEIYFTKSKTKNRPHPC